MFGSNEYAHSWNRVALSAIQTGVNVEINTMKNATTKLSVMALAFCLAGAALAQTNGPTGLSVRAGAHWPNVGDVNFGVGVDYKFKSVYAEPARGAYLSYFGASADWYGDGDNWNLPLAVTYNARANNLVFSAGVGWDFSRNDGDDDSGLGAQVGVSYEFGDTATPGTTPFFVQAKYFFAHDTDLSGFGLYAGVRF